MNASEIVAHLEGRDPNARSRRNREGDYHVTCPAHADRTPSLHVTDKGSQALLCCQAGCETQAVLDAGGLDWGDLFHDRANGADRWQPRSKPNASKPAPAAPLDDGLLAAMWKLKRWTREACEALGVGWDGERIVLGAVRYAPEPIRGDDQVKMLALAGSKRDLWPAPESIEGEEAWIGEGEPDAVSGHSAGLPLVSVPGTNGWRPEYAPRFVRFERVTVATDCDAPGRALRDRICADLVAAGVAEVVPFDLAPGHSDGFDLSDALAADVDTPGELRAAGQLLRATAEASRAAMESATGDGQASGTVAVAPGILALLMNMKAAIDQADEPIPYLADPLAAPGTLTVLVGRHSSLKSWLMMMVSACCHQGGGDLGGIRCEPATALYVDAENGARVMGRRFRAAGITADGLLVADGRQITLLRDIGKLRDLIVATTAQLVVLDSLRRLTPGLRESDSDDMAPVMAALANLARELNVAIVLIHHRSSKAGAATLRGSSAIEDQADCVLQLERHPGRRVRLWVGAGGKFRIDEEPAPIWLSLASVDGVMAVGSCEPVADGEGDEGPSADQLLANRIDALAAQVAIDGGWPPKRLAAAVNEEPDSGTLTRALSLLYVAGRWEAIGATRSRLIRPVLSRHSGQPLAHGENGENQQQTLEGEGEAV